MKKIQQVYNVGDINFIKPGIGETTRGLLRRIPWKVLVSEKHKDSEELAHIIQLAQEKEIDIEFFELETYKCCGIIKKLADV